MKRLLSRKILLTILVLSGAVFVFTFSTRSSAVDFNTEVKPIFNKKCISCHGGVKRQGGFSVLFRSEALANTESGKPAIIPGDPGKSEMIRRLTLNDPEERMPYKHEPLSEDEINTLRKWIKQGAPWGDHWAYVPVKPVKVPDGDDGAKSSIDHFIYEKLKEQKLSPSPEADKKTLLRRASLDIIGLPASSALAQQFLGDNSANAYEKLVDTLLASPHYGEKWTAMWLDLARYADTKGYERDDSRSIWRYRDWLIDAFNADKPYDQFLTEQIAGDLIPNATDAQYIATAFHRNTMTNDEGGTDNEEFRTAAVMDRVNTTWEVLMGTTFACVQCHSHPYDPFTHEEYYKFLAFFNNSRDDDTEEDYPLLRHFNDSLQQEVESLTAWLRKVTTEEKAVKWNRFVRTWEPSIHSLTADKFINSELSDTKWLVFRNHGVARLKQVSLEDIDQLVFRYFTSKPGGTWVIHLDSATGPVLKSIPAAPVKGGYVIAKVDFPKRSGVHDLYLTYSNPNLKNPDESGLFFDWFHFTEQFPGSGQPEYEKYKEKYWSLLSVITPTTPVMMDNPEEMHRSTHVFERGNWLVKGDEVKPDVPHALQPLPANAPRNRMGLAMWLVDKKNPLTARTLVNRVWEQLFGAGLVETLEDMGTQGAPPTHVELLDYLSWQFMNEYKWSVKRLVREIVLSATYRQDSKVTPELLEKDPYNKWYARGSRVRLSAEQVRDQSLLVSGLLNPQLKGPSVFPYQPKGIWLSPWNGADWRMSLGDQKYRRAIYTYWKRTAPYPATMTFDGVAREVCTSRRVRTNTPLQALVTLNDESYLEMARHFAYRMQQEGGKEIPQQINKGYELAIGRPAAEKTVQVLMKLYNESLARFKNDKEKTCEMVGIMDERNTPETAALVVVANAMLNLDELITKN